MNALARAIRISLRYRWSIAASLLCSALVAIFWGANIGAVFPLVEVVVQQGQSMHQWIDNREADSTHAALQARIRAAQFYAQANQIAEAEPAASGQLSRLGDRQLALARAEQSKADRARSLEPWIKSILPADAFLTLVAIVVFLVAGTAVRCIFLTFSMVLVARVSSRTVLDLQNALFRRTLNMEMGAFGARGTGDLINRLRGETAQIGIAINTLFGKTIREPMKMGACLAGAAVVNWRLLLFSLIVCPLAIAAMVGIAHVTKRANRRAMEQSARLLDRLFQAITNVKIVKAFTMERHERARFKTIAHEVYGKGMRIAWLTALGRSNSELVGVMVICFSLLAGGYLVLNGRTDIGGIVLASTPMTFAEIMVFFAFLIGVADPLRKMADAFQDIQTGIVAAERCFPLLDQQPSIANPRQPKEIPMHDVSIELRNVSFAYDANTPVLQHVNLVVPTGTCLAIVGANGCGKSTLINLIPRFYEADQGAVLIGGVNVREVRLKPLRRAIAYVTQHTMLFDDTIEANIRYGMPNADENQIIQAARRAEAHEFITQLEEGYQTRIGEQGSRLSGGQRQRIALARAILKNPHVLLLDEATSQIDPQSEQLIHRALQQFIRGRTTIMVTHRLATLQLADRIAVMDQGRIVDCGTHEHLMARCSMYRQLYGDHVREAA